jgi:phage major head subunit gpT-like protein
MIITSTALTGIYNGFSMAFNQGFESVESIWSKIAMKTSSVHAEETYGWMEKVPYMREWIGPRTIVGLAASGYKITNRDFEQTIGVPRNNIEDDTYGLFAPMFTEMGRSAAEQPDKMVTELLAGGFDNDCYDGQRFFDTDHPVKVTENDTAQVSNMQAGAGEPWFLLDTSRALRALVYQERRPFAKLVKKDDESDDNVFFNKEYIYGSDGRGNAGYGLWQLAFGSKATLDATNYAAARAAMHKMRGENGRKLNIKPTVLVCGPDNEEKALALLNAENIADGATNVWRGTAQLIVSAWLDA